MDVLKSDHINADIDWSSLILLGTLIGLVNTILYLDLGTVLAKYLPWLSNIMETNPRVFIGILSAVVLVARFFIPIAGAIVALFFLPLAVANGVHPWVVVFTILMMDGCWFMPYQSDSYTMFRSMVGLHKSYEESLFLKINAASVAIRIAAIAASVPYWEYMKML